MTKSNFDKEGRLWMFMTPDEEKEFYNEVLERVIANPRYYLDNLHELDSFWCSFINYPSSARKSLKNRNIYK